MKKIWSNNKGVLNNKTFETITIVLWIVAVVSMIGLLITIKQLKAEVKDISKELVKYRK